MKHIIISPRILHLCLQLSSVGFFFLFLNWKTTPLYSVKSILFSDPNKSLCFDFSLISFSRFTLRGQDALCFFSCTLRLFIYTQN